jgi:hypothetical protein
MKLLLLTLSATLVLCTARAQNVGINQANPQFRLDVYGTLNLDSGYYYSNGYPAMFCDAHDNSVFGKYAGIYATLALPYNTLVGTLAGGIGTILSGNTAVGRATSTIGGNYAVAIGNAATANYDYSVALGSNATAPAANTIQLGSFITGLYCNVGLTVTSDARKKEHFSLVDGEKVLGQISGMHLNSWNLKGQDEKHFRHYGPVAQEFYAAFGKDAFGLIGTDTTINEQDLNGINMIAVQALEKRTREWQDLKQENTALKADLKNLESDMAQLKSSVVEENRELREALVLLQKKIALLAASARQPDANATALNATPNQ